MTKNMIYLLFKDGEEVEVKEEVATETETKEETKVEEKEEQPKKKETKKETKKTEKKTDTKTEKKTESKTKSSGGLPGFDKVPDGGKNHVTEADDMYENGNKIGDMD